MKSLLLFLAISGISTPIIAQTEPLVVAPVEGRELRFNWPRSGDVFMRDVRAVTLPGGRSRLQLQGLGQIAGDAAAYAPNLKIGAPARLLKSLPTPKTGTSAPKRETASFFESFIGQRVSLVQENKGGEKVVSGILRLTDGRYSLETEGGILFAPGGQWLLPGALKPDSKAGKTEAGKTERETEAPSAFDPVYLVEGSGQTAVEANYTLKDLSWAPRYTGFLSPDRTKVQMQGAITLSTPDNFDFRGAIFKLVDAEGIVKIADDTELRAGQTALGFWNGVFTVTQALSFYNGEWTKNIGSDGEYAPVQRTYKTVENGGAFLPRGPLTLWQQSEDGTTKPSEFESFGATASAAPLILPLSDQTDESSVLRVVSSNKLLNPQTREVIITWKVRGKEGGPALSITDTLPDGASIKEASLKPTENSGRTLRFEARGTTEFSYRFQIPTR